MALKSPWTEQSNRVIRAVLASLPETATEKEIRRALREAYPFHDRAHWPYKMWCKAVRKALDKDNRIKKSTVPPVVRYTLGETPERHPFWLNVSCGWCNRANTKTFGCMVCNHMVQTMLELVQTDEWAHWIGQIRLDPELAGIFADFLDDRGHVEIGAAFRNVELP